MNLSFDSHTLTWLFTAVLLVAIELFSVQFGFILAAAAALLAALTSVSGYAFEWQLAVFAVSTILFLGLLRHRIITKIQSKETLPSRTDVLLGKVGTVTETIQPETGSGRAEIAGQDWAAHSKAILQAGTRVRVVGADGIVLEVEPIETAVTN